MHIEVTCIRQLQCQQLHVEGAAISQGLELVDSSPALPHASSPEVSTLKPGSVEIEDLLMTFAVDSFFLNSDVDEVRY